jgi:hypothetical protein
MTNISYSLGEGEYIYTDITIIGNNISIKISLYDEIQVDIRIYIDLPKKSDHNKHIMGDVCVT